MRCSGSQTDPIERPWNARGSGAPHGRGGRPPSHTDGFGNATTSDPGIDESVRAAYDVVAGDYAAEYAAELRDKPLDRALIEAFARQVKALGSGGGEPVVADVGCGPGHATRVVADLGLPVIGVDPSPG